MELTFVCVVSGKLAVLFGFECCHFATQVLEMDVINVKALYRRSQAYIQLADLDLAELDIKKALEIDPSNRHVPSDLVFSFVLSRKLLVHVWEIFFLGTLMILYFHLMF